VNKGRVVEWGSFISTIGSAVINYRVRLSYNLGTNVIHIGIYLVVKAYFASAGSAIMSYVLL